MIQARNIENFLTSWLNNVFLAIKVNCVQSDFEKMLQQIWINLYFWNPKP